MTREEIIQQLSGYFQPIELVCDHTYKKWRSASWQFLRTEYLHNLLVVRRDILKVPMTCNSGSAHQRGLRCNCCQLVNDKTRSGISYLSAHVLGCAGDFTPKGMTAEQARQLIIAKQDLLPYPLRLEGGVSWLHMDTIPQDGVTEKVYVFKA